MGDTVVKVSQLDIAQFHFGTKRVEQRIHLGSIEAVSFGGDVHYRLGLVEFFNGFLVDLWHDIG